MTIQVLQEMAAAHLENVKRKINEQSIATINYDALPCIEISIFLHVVFSNQ
jgi:hypothetical protein